MIEKIIANGTPGAGAMALDIAIKLGIPHDGWVSGDRPADKKYGLRRLSSDMGASCLEAAICKADGTLCFTVSRPFSLVTEGVRKMAERFGKPFLAVDVTKTCGFDASRKAAAWIDENRIQILHVEGGGYDASFDTTVADVLEATFFLSMMETHIALPDSQAAGAETHPADPSFEPPETLEAAADHLETALSLKDKARIANMAETELGSLHFSLGTYINNRFGLYSPGSFLLTDCQRRSGRWQLLPEDAAAVIIRFVWQRFRKTYRVRVVR